MTYKPINQFICGRLLCVSNLLLLEINCNLIYLGIILKLFLWAMTKATKIVPISTMKKKNNKYTNV